MFRITDPEVIAKAKYVGADSSYQYKTNHRAQAEDCVKYIITQLEKSLNILSTFNQEYRMVVDRQKTENGIDQTQLRRIIEVLDKVDRISNDEKKCLTNIRRALEFKKFDYMDCLALTPDLYELEQLNQKLIVAIRQPVLSGEIYIEDGLEECQVIIHSQIIALKAVKALA